MQRVEIRKWTLLLRILPALAAVLLASCGSVYERDFEAETARIVGPPRGPEGPWNGEWKSEVNGHHGPLWCIISPADEPGFHEFRYRAGWEKIKFGDYTHRAATRRRSDGALEFSGSMDLPGGAGRHDVEGTVTAERFDARFKSERGDRGTMILRRP